MNNLTKGLIFTLTPILVFPLIANEVKAEEVCIQSIANPCKPEVSEISERAKRRAERILDSDNCALYTYGNQPQIHCAYGRAEKRQQILNDVRADRARPFYGDGETLQFYIDRVGLNQVVVTLQNLDVDYSQ
ncbi:MAG: hypothetical protein AB4060_02870 [Crocosphaera sp.]